MFRARSALRRGVTTRPASSVPGGSSPIEGSSFFSPSRITLSAAEAASPGTRWRQVIPSVAVHLCLGAPFAWSVFNAPLTKALGVLSPAAADWSLGAVVPVVSAVFAMQGVSAALLGKFLESLSPRLNGMMAAAAFGGGFVMAGLGVHLHNLPLLYLGYGLFAGLGIGVGYVPAVKNLMGWFPDRTGFATGVTICGFGGAALLAAPVADGLIRYFARAPTFLGRSELMRIATVNGEQVATHPQTGETVRVVVAQASDIATSNFPSLAEGVYLVGSGSTGVAETMMVFGAAYFSVMAAAAMSFRSAPKNFIPAGWTPPAKAAGALQTYVPIENVMKTPQFWLAFTMLGCLATSGLAVASVAKTLMMDIFRPNLPLIVTAGFASGYVMALSMANLTGRLLWSSVSDAIGRRRMFAIMSFGSIPLYAAMPLLTQYNHSPLAMSAFYGCSLLSFSFFGAAYAMMPALEADMFGKKAITATHGRMLLASSLAAVAGPSIIVALRTMSETKAIRGLAAVCDPALFMDRFGSPISALEELVAAKTVTISKLLSICPPGTVDPSSFLYNDTLFFSAGLMSIAGMATLALKPVSPRFLVVDGPESEGAKLAPSSIGRVFIVCVDESPASASAYAWCLSQATPGLDMIVPLAVVQSKLPEVPKLLHRFVMAAKEKGLFVTPLFSPSSNVGTTLAAVVRAKKPYAVVVGKGQRSELASFLVGEVKQVPLLAFVQESEHFVLKQYEEQAVRSDVTWSELINTDGSIYEAFSKHNVKNK